MRIISTGDGIDFYDDDDWLKIQFQFLINEITGHRHEQKGALGVRRRQADSKWICADPCGYVIDKVQNFAIVSEKAAVIR